MPPASCPGCGIEATAIAYDDIDEPLSAPPAGCMSAQQLEQWFVAIGKAAEASAAAIEQPARPPKGRRKPRKRRLNFHDHGAIAKHRENAIKAMRAAAELALRREKRIVERQRGATN